MNVKDIITTQINIVEENTSVEQISAKLFAEEFNGVPVVNDKDLVVGIVSTIDIL